MPSFFTIFWTTIALLIIAYITNLALNITPTREPQYQWPSELWKQFNSYNGVGDPGVLNPKTSFPASNKIYNSNTRDFEYGRYHHKDTESFEKMDFSFPNEAYSGHSSSSKSTKDGGSFLQKITTLKEWSFSAFTDGTEWFCGSALSSAQIASGLFAYCYNAKTGRSFHVSHESLEWFLFGYGFGTQMKSDDANKNSSPYANRGSLEWDNGKISNDHVAWARHGYNKTTKMYQVQVRMVANEYVLDERTEYKTLTEDAPVIMEFEYSFPMSDLLLSNTKIMKSEGMTIIYPLAANVGEGRVGMSTKYSGIQATVEKFSIKKKTSFNTGKKGEEERTIVDMTPSSSSSSSKSNNSKNFVAHLDWTRSMFPRHTVWYWICFGATTKSSNTNNTKTSLGMQLTSLSYLGDASVGMNYSLESTIWIDGQAFVVDGFVNVSEQVAEESNDGDLPAPVGGKEKMKRKIGRKYKIHFDHRERASSCSGDKFVLEMTFVRKGAHVQDFSEFRPIHDGQLEHQWGDFTGQLSHYKGKDNNKLHHVYGFANVPGILEDHDTWW